MFRGAPGIGCSFWRRPASSRGTLCSRPSVYGWRGCAKRRVGGAGLHEHAGVHDVHALAHAGDDAEVVRDHDQRRVELGDEASSAPRGSAPGSSRRARSSARRRSGASARRRARSRSSRAAASRPRTGAGSPSAAASRSGSRPGRAAPSRACRPARGPSRSASRAPRGSAARSSAPGSARSSGPGRSSRSRGRGSSAAARRSAASRSRPPNIAVPLVTRPLRARIPSSASEVTLLPQPDSPTIPSVSPGAMSNEIPLTA